MDVLKELFAGGDAVGRSDGENCKRGTGLTGLRSKRSRVERHTRQCFPTVKRRRSVEVWKVTA